MNCEHDTSDLPSRYPDCPFCLAAALRELVRERDELQELVRDAQEELRKCQQDAIELQARLGGVSAPVRTEPNFGALRG